MRIHAYNALRPRADIADKVAAPPYDTVDTPEAAQLAEGNPMSFLHINHSEIDLPAGTDLYADAVYAKAAENLQNFKKQGWLFAEDRPLMYLYAQTMGAHTQTGLVCCCHIDDYIKDVIKKHEFTRKDKEDDRTKHTATINANIGPVFIAYRDVPEIRAALAPIPQGRAPLYDFVDELNVRHQVWPVDNAAEIEQLFADKVPVSYIADGHHRSASAVRVGAERRAANPGHHGNEEYNWFLSVLFPGLRTEDPALQPRRQGSQRPLRRGIPQGNPGHLHRDGKRRPEPEVAAQHQHVFRRPMVRPGLARGEEPTPSTSSMSARSRMACSTRCWASTIPRTNNRIKFIGGIRGPRNWSSWWTRRDLPSPFRCTPPRSTS
jgi:uncharacterized protein (DUF1015 family)